MKEHNVNLEWQQDGGMEWQCSDCGKIFDDLAESWVRNCGGTTFLERLFIKNPKEIIFKKYLLKDGTKVIEKIINY